MILTENGVDRTNGSCTQNYMIHYGLQTKTFKSVYTALNVMKLTRIIQMLKSIFDIKMYSYY